jgi:hypothetical protein
MTGKQKGHMTNMARPNWSRLLPRPLVIPTVIQLSTLAEVRALLDRHLPRQTRNKPTWRYVRKKLAEAAYGGNVVDLAAALQIALKLEGIEYQPK